MKVIFLNSFKKDLKKIKSNSLKSKIKDVIIDIEKAGDLKSIKNSKRLAGNSTAYRIRTGNYRLGYYYENDTVELARFLKRNDIYKVFPK